MFEILSHRIRRRNLNTEIRKARKESGLIQKEDTADLAVFADMGASLLVVANGLRALRN